MSIYKLTKSFGNHILCVYYARDLIQFNRKYSLDSYLNILFKFVKNVKNSIIYVDIVKDEDITKPDITDCKVQE